MIVFVDYEHADARSNEWGEKVLAARTWITYRLEDLAEQPCHLVRYDRVDATLLEQLGATALFISGNGTDPSHYDPERLAPLHAIIEHSPLPIFGFCGGFQCIAQALGIELTLIDVDDQTPADLLRPFGEADDGTIAMGEAGYHPVTIDAEHAVVDRLEPLPVFRHAHRLQVPALPDGFEALASTSITPIQMAVSDERRMVGTQFHPEYWTKEHPAGRLLIENFLRWANVSG